jgi:hypothetical protein
MALRGVGVFDAEGEGHRRWLQQKGHGDDQGFGGLMELELSGFGAEEGDSL